MGSNSVWTGSLRHASSTVASVAGTSPGSSQVGSGSGSTSNAPHRAARCVFCRRLRLQQLGEARVGVACRQESQANVQSDNLIGLPEVAKLGLSMASSMVRSTTPSLLASAASKAGAARHRTGERGDGVMARRGWSSIHCRCSHPGRRRRLTIAVEVCRRDQPAQVVSVHPAERVGIMNEGVGTLGCSGCAPKRGDKPTVGLHEIARLCCEQVVHSIAIAVGHHRARQSEARPPVVDMPWGPGGSRLHPHSRAPPAPVDAPRQPSGGSCVDDRALASGARPAQPPRLPSGRCGQWVAPDPRFKRSTTSSSSDGADPSLDKATTQCVGTVGNQ